MTTTLLLNPNGQLLVEVASRLRQVRKTKPLWARLLDSDCEVESREGRLQARAGDYICRGVVGEQWPQEETKLFEKYVATGQFDADGWQRFDPKPDTRPVLAAQIDHAFRVVAHWGELNGKAGDYVVRSQSDVSDIWIVDKTIFEATYEKGTIE